MYTLLYALNHPGFSWKGYGKLKAKRWMMEESHVTPVGFVELDRVDRMDSVDGL